VGGEIKKVAGTEEGRLRKDKHNPPLKTRPGQKRESSHWSWSDVQQKLIQLFTVSIRKQVVGVSRLG
jgi:hypothetical protein